MVNLAERFSEDEYYDDMVFYDGLEGAFVGIGYRFHDGPIAVYDKEKVLDYLGEDWRAVVRPEFRITGVKAVAESRGDDANVIVESLFQKVITNNNLTILPESKAPKWMKELEDGEEQDLWEKKQKS